MNRIIVGVFGVILALSLITQAMPDQSFSEQENRYLQTMPKLSWNNIVSGVFTSQFEAYIQDHFFFREEWMKWKTQLEQVVGKQESNGVYLGKEGWYFEVDHGPDNQQMNTNITYLADVMAWLDEQSIDTSFLPIYSSYMFYEDFLPKHHLNYNQQLGLQQIQAQLQRRTIYASFDELMKHKDEAIYFKNDHHWTQLGAYYAYVSVAKEKGWDVVPIDQYLAKRSENPFFGTLYSKAPRQHQSGDAFVYYLDQTTQYQLIIPETNVIHDSLYLEEFLTQKDQYVTFLGGNNGVTVIQKELATESETDSESKTTLVMFKDSYSHALAPFLAQHYDEVVLIDLRYFNGSVRDYIVRLQPDEVMFAYHISWFGNDVNIAKWSR